MKVKVKELHKITYFLNRFSINWTIQSEKEFRNMIYALDIEKCENELRSNILNISDGVLLTRYQKQIEYIVNDVEEIINQDYFTDPRPDDLAVYISQIEKRLNTLNQVFKNALRSITPVLIDPDQNSKPKDKKDLNPVELEKFYDKEVTSMFDHKKKEFEKRLYRSDNRERLIDKEIQDINRLFTREIKASKIVENYKDSRLRRYQTIYDQIITEGEKDYNIIIISPINEDDMIDYKEELKKLEEARDNGIFDDKAITEEQIPTLNRKIKLLQENITNGYILKVDPYFGDNINVKADVKYLEWLEELKKTKSTDPALIELPKSASITINSDIMDKLYHKLKDYFPDREEDLKSVLISKSISKPLIFPHNQNKFVEVFRRLKYNCHILDTPTEIKNWICHNFKRKKGNSIAPFNPSTVWDILTKGKGEPTKKERICIVDWLPYKSILKLQTEAQKEIL